MLSFDERAGGFTGLKHRHHRNHIVPRKIVRGQIIIDMRIKIIRIKQVEIIGEARGLLSVSIVVYFLEIRGELVSYVRIINFPIYPRRNITPFTVQFLPRFPEFSTIFIYQITMNRITTTLVKSLFGLSRSQFITRVSALL